MVKPQFEVGRERLGKGGVVRDPALHRQAVDQVVAEARRCGWPAGDVRRAGCPARPATEFFVCLLRDCSTRDDGRARH